MVTPDADEVAARLFRVPFDLQAIVEFANAVGAFRARPNTGDNRLSGEATRAAEFAAHITSIREVGVAIADKSVALTWPPPTPDFAGDLTGGNRVSEIMTEMRDLYLARTLLATICEGLSPDPLRRPDSVPSEAFYWASIPTPLPTGVVTEETMYSIACNDNGEYTGIKANGSSRHFWLELIYNDRPLLVEDRENWILMAWPVLENILEDRLNVYTRRQLRRINNDPRQHKRQLITHSPMGAAWEVLYRSAETRSARECKRCGEPVTPHPRFRRGNALYCTEKCRRWIKRKRALVVGLQKKGLTPAKIAKELGLGKELVYFLIKTAEEARAQAKRVKVKRARAKRARAEGSL